MLHKAGHSDHHFQTTIIILSVRFGCKFHRLAGGSSPVARPASKLSKTFYITGISRIPAQDFPCFLTAYHHCSAHCSPTLSWCTLSWCTEKRNWQMHEILVPSPLIEVDWCAWDQKMVPGIILAKQHSNNFMLTKITLAACSTFCPLPICVGIKELLQVQATQTTNILCQHAGGF